MCRYRPWGCEFVNTLITPGSRVWLCVRPRPTASDRVRAPPWPPLKCFCEYAVRAGPCCRVPSAVGVKFRSETGNADTRSTRHKDKRSGNGGQATLHDRRRTQRTHAHEAQGRIISKAQPQTEPSRRLNAKTKTQAQTQGRRTAKAKSAGQEEHRSAAPNRHRGQDGGGPPHARTQHAAEDQARQRQRSADGWWRPWRHVHASDAGARPAARSRSPNAGGTWR